MKPRTDSQLMMFRVGWLCLAVIFVIFLWISLASHDHIPIIFTVVLGIALGFFAPGLEKDR